MRQHLYITAAEAQSGKSVVTLGLMERLAARGTRLGYFRPVVRSPQDDLLHLLRDKMQLGDRASYGMLYNDVKKSIAAGAYQNVLKSLLQAFRNLQDHCDQVVCTGTDFTGVPSALEFDFNADVANNLGCLVIPVVNGLHRTRVEILEAYTAMHASLRDRSCDIFISFINRVDPRHCDNLQQHFAPFLDGDDPVFVLAEERLLIQPTLRDVMQGLPAKLLYGDEQSLNRAIAHITIAAMALPAFLTHIEAGALVITPGDRADIILACMAANPSSAYPPIAGVLLTGAAPISAVDSLIRGLDKPPFAVLAVDDDTLTTSMGMQRIHARLSVHDHHKMAVALKLTDTAPLMDILDKRLAVESSRRVTPLMFEHTIVQRAKADKKHMVLPEGTDLRILKAAEILLARDVVTITLLGNVQLIREKILQAGLNLPDIAIIDPVNSPRHESYAQSYHDLRKHKGITLEMARDIITDVSFFGTMMVYRGEADGMVSGAAHTTQHTIRPAFQFIKARPGADIVSSVFFMCLPDRVLVYGDCAINPDPNADQLADIALAAADTAAMFGITPLVAMLSYSSGSSGQGTSVDKVREATNKARQRRPELCIEGPIQYDAAVDPGVAQSKMPDSTVAGRASVFIFPDLNTGNNTYKAVQRSAGAVAVGPVLQGLNKPVNDLSRGCTVADIVNTVAITAIQAQQHH